MAVAQHIDQDDKRDHGDQVGEGSTEAGCHAKVTSQRPDAMALEAACDAAPTMAPGQALAVVRRSIGRGVADSAPEQLKRLLGTVVEQILVGSRACIQPYFIAPTVRTRTGPRRRTGIEPPEQGRCSHRF